MCANPVPYFISLPLNEAVQTFPIITLLNFVVKFSKKINLVFSNLQILMTVSTALVKTVVLVWMASPISRVTALRGILGVIAKQVCSFEEKN